MGDVIHANAGDVTEAREVYRLHEPALFISDWKIRRTKFDGFEFSDVVVNACPHWLYLAAKARRGDDLARELLTAAKVTVQGADGKTYWPVSEGGAQ